MYPFPGTLLYFINRHMKYIFLTLVLFLSAVATACGIHQFKVPLNQRGFYNPAALCPYCEGSSFFATGAFAGARTNDVGMFVTLGNDGDNTLHGAWDLSYSYMSGDDNSIRSFGTRYAFKTYIRSWALAAGLRTSYNTYTMLLPTAENFVANAARSCFSFDAGIYVTDQHGFYIGISALNLHEPFLEMKFETPGGSEYYEVRTKRTYTGSVGGLVTLTHKIDVMLDASAATSNGNYSARPSFLARYKYHWGIGSAVTLSDDQSPVFELQGGFTSTPFKWLAGVAFTEQGPVIETGMVIRFGLDTGGGIRNWRFTRIDGRCVSQPIKSPKKTEFWKED